MLSAYVQNNVEGTELVNKMLITKLDFVLKNHRSIDVGNVLRNEMSLLSDICLLEDACWESRLR